MKVYSQQGDPLTKEMLDSAYEGLSEHEKETVDRQIDYIDTDLKTRRIAAGHRYGAKTGFGRVSGMELIAALGIWFKKIEEKDPDAWRRMAKNSGKKEAFSVKKI